VYLCRVPVDGKLFSVGAEEDKIPLALFKIFPRGVKVKSPLFLHGVELFLSPGVVVEPRVLQKVVFPWNNSPIPDGKILVRNYLVNIHGEEGADSVALGTHAHGGVEREELGHELWKGSAAAGASLAHP